MTAKVPRKSDVGFKHIAEKPEGSHFWRVSGPGLNDDVLASDKDDADTIAAALNLATNFNAIRRNADRLQSELEFFKEFK